MLQKFIKYSVIILYKFLNSNCPFHHNNGKYFIIMHIMLLIEKQKTIDLPLYIDVHYRKQNSDRLYQNHRVPS